jgi:hypothetical protein
MDTDFFFFIGGTSIPASRRRFTLRGKPGLQGATVLEKRFERRYKDTPLKLNQS